MKTQIVVVAKAPVPGRVKTRLCPPCTPQQAASIADAALCDTIAAVDAASAARRVLLLDGQYPQPPGWDVVPQRGDGLGARLANGLADSARTGTGTLLIGMDTPQVTSALLTEVMNGLSTSEAVLGLAADGGWWALALRDPRTAHVLQDVPMSQPNTGQLTSKAFTGQGLSLGLAPVLRDIDTITDLREVARLCPGAKFAAALRELA